MFRRMLRIVFSQRTMVIFLLLLQIALLVFIVAGTSMYSDTINLSLQIVSLLVVLYIFGKKDKPAFKLSWVFLILLIPVFGGMLFLLFTLQTNTRGARRAGVKIEEATRHLFPPAVDVLPKLAQECPDCSSQVRYLQEYAGFPVYQHTQTEYLTPGEAKFERLVQELKKAEKYIFMEYFIVDEGIMWDTVLEILREKAARGVEVRFIYDDMGCLFRLPPYYYKTMESYGIKCAVFNRFRPVLSTLQNNRDHRKIAVIDGKVAFTGGINLADEYINVVERFGHWKDAAIMVEGDAAWSLTLIFLQMWSLTKNTTEDYGKYHPWQDQPCPVFSDGYVQPYADSPIDNENVGEHVYIRIINNAKQYLYITTPYLIIDDSMLSALALAAKSGVDVRIVTPHRWDKQFVHVTTRSYYRELISAGVKIYEYSRGFIHSKTFVSDDMVATVGTTNLDFRSLYLHFECGVWLYNSRSVLSIKEDFLRTLESCQEITLEDCKSNAVLSLIQEILRIFAPLM